MTMQRTISETIQFLIVFIPALLGMIVICKTFAKAWVDRAKELNAGVEAVGRLAAGHELIRREIEDLKRQGEDLTEDQGELKRSLERLASDYYNHIQRELDTLRNTRQAGRFNLDNPLNPPKPPRDRPTEPNKPII